ncbi:unnamed protein product [Diamesa serratosioi]
MRCVSMSAVSENEENDEITTIQVYDSGISNDQSQSDYKTKDFANLMERLLCTNDRYFTSIMDFMKQLNVITDIPELHREMGYTFITKPQDFLNKDNKLIFINNLKYLHNANCDLNLELFNYLRSLAFGGNYFIHEMYIDVIHIFLPFLTDFFINPKYWDRIKYFCGDTKAVANALKYLIESNGTEDQFKYLPKQPAYNAFSLCHLSRNALRAQIYKGHKFNDALYNNCASSLPHSLMNFMIFRH